MKESFSNLDEPLNVLVVEDNEVDRRMLENMLKENPHTAAHFNIAHSLETSKQLLEKEEYDVIVLDLNLPDSKGEKSLTEISKLFPRTAIVVNTGAYEDDTGIQTLGKGAQDFLVKGKYNAYNLNKVLHFAVERKRLELRLIEAHQKLRRTQIQLNQSEKFKVIGSLASGVAHEVKNPLATIIYGITYLNERVHHQDSNVHLALKNIEEAANKANEIITGLLNFSQVTRIHKGKENINEIIEQTLILLKHEFVKNHVEVVKKLDAHLPKIDVDKNRIEQVLANLVINAIHAASLNGRIQITTESQKLSWDLHEIPEEDRDGFKLGQSVVAIYVDDDGQGISEDNLSKVFHPFFTTKRDRGGVGLGLCVCKNIVQKHEGIVFLENRKEGGARATLIFKV